MSHLHVPHLHLADRFMGAFGEDVLVRMLHHRPDPIVPDGHDWNEWHWYEPEGKR